MYRSTVMAVLMIMSALLIRTFDTIGKGNAVYTFSAGPYETHIGITLEDLANDVFCRYRMQK